MFKFLKDKKGMGIQQVFVFIVAAITFALVLIFGYSSISDFIDKGEQVEFYQFKSSLESSIKKIYSEYGAVRQETYYLPGAYHQVCFIDLDHEPSSLELNALCEIDPLACDVWESAKESGMGHAGADENVFLTPSAPVSLKVYKVDIDGGYLCIDISKGSFTLRLEGKGAETYLSQPLAN